MTTNFGYSLLFLIFIYISPVFPSGTIKVTITNYENPSELDMTGRCCDGVNKDGCPQGKCDLSFEVCLRNTNTGSAVQECLSLTPEEDISKKNLTEKFTFNVIEETYMLLINVTDVDPTDRVPVDLFNISISRNGTSRTIVAHGHRMVKPTSIVVHVEHTCDKYFYQEDCSKKCVAADDCTGHYKCDLISGDKLCLAGWKGDSCTELISGSEADCSVYQDAGFVSSAWDGIVVCPKFNRSLSMNITKDNVNSSSAMPEVSGYVTVGSNTLVVTGNYVFFIKQLFLESLSKVLVSNKMMRELQIYGSMENQTLMNGTLVLEGETCLLQADRLEGYFDACQGLGTCVRYGPQKDDYYCCCNGNIQATSCITSHVSSSTSYTKPSNITSTTSTPSFEVTSQQQPTNTTMETSNTESTTTSPRTIIATESTEPAVDSTTDLSSLEPTTPTSTGQTSESISETTTYSGTTTEATSKTTSTSGEPSTAGAPSTSEASSTSGPKSTYSSSSTSPATSTSMTTLSTPEETFSTTVTPSTTAEPTTTEAPSVFEPHKTYSLELEAEEEELEGEEQMLEELLVEAWSQANTQFTELTEDSYSINVIHIKGGVGEDGTLMVEVAYTVNISSTSINMSELVSPTRAQLTLSVRKRYNLNLYTGTSFIYVYYSLSLYIAGRPPMVEQYLELDEHLLQLWYLESSFENSTTLNITTAATSEYLGPNGEEVTRIYYFLYIENELLDPANVTEPNVTSLGRYEVYQLDITSLVRYRFTFSVNIKGELSNLDHSIVREQIEMAWNETNQTNIGVHLLRAERYTTAIGVYVTKVIYITINGNATILPARNSGPNSSVLEEHLQVNNTRGEILELYKGSDMYRYSFHLGVFVLGELDGEHDADKFLAGLEAAWQSTLIDKQEWELKMYKFHYVTVQKYISKNGDFVDMLLYFLTKRGQIIDGTQFQELPVSNLTAHVQVRRGDGQNYTLTTGTDLLEERVHLTILFRGVVLTPDLITLSRVLLETWNLTITAVKYQKVLVSAYEEMITETGELVTRVYYTYYENNITVTPVNVAHHLKTFKTTFTFQLTLLTSPHVQYKVYTGSEVGLVSRRSLTDLYFQSQVARLDYSILQTRLSAYLSLYLGLTDIKLMIKRQEEYHISNSTTARCWKLSLAITRGSTPVFPTFYKKIITTDLSERLNVTALTDQKYTLYTGETTLLLPYHYHFQLHFRERVSKIDWFRIKAMLEVAWNAQYGVNVSVQLGGVEEVVSIEGTSYWRLVYFMSWKASGKLIYSGSWKNLDVTQFNFDFTNAMGTTYTVVDYSLPLWRVSSAFRLLTSTSVTESYTSQLASNLLSTWCKTIANLGRKFNCTSATFTVIRPRYIKLSSGISVWRLYYFIKYDGLTVASLSWPTFDLDAFKISIEGQIPAMFYHWNDLDPSFWNFRFFLFFKSKLEKTKYAQVEASILESWKKENNVSKDVKAKAIIDTQTEVITETGTSEWRIGYHIEVDGTIIRPEETHHVNTTELRISLKNLNSMFDITISNNMTYVAKENMAALYVESNIHKEDYEKFRLSLERYYRNKTDGNSTISVVLGPIEEVVTSEGKSEWKLTYVVKKDGKTIHSTPIKATEETELSTWFKFKSKFGLGYKFSFISKKEKHSQSTILGINLKAKVSKLKYTYIEGKLREAISAINTDVAFSSVSVKILGQREMVTETGETTWRVDYGVYINGTRVDASFLVAPSHADLQKRLVFEGTQNSVVDISTTETQSYLSLHELHFNRPVAALDLVNVTSAVQRSWASVLNVSVSEIEVVFKKSKEYVDNEGKSFWSWTYSLKWNSTILTRVDLSAHEKELKVKVKAEVEKIETTKGDKYLLVDTQQILEYSKHFPLYFTVKVAEKDFIEIEQHLKKVWREERGMDVQIDVLKQLEVIDKSGRSYWELVYFVTSNDTSGEATVLDSRVEEFTNVTALLSKEIANMTDVNEHVYEVATLVGSVYRADLAFSLFLSAKFGVTEESQLREYIEQTVRNNSVYGNETITIEFLKVDEVTTGTFESAWRYLVSISVDGKLLHPLSSLTGQWPRLDLVTSTGHHLAIASIQETVYSFRSSFSFFLEKNISFSSWQDVRLALARVWETREEYTNCSCLDFVLGSIHEVVDRSGKTFFKILYFAKQNGTIVDSLTTRKVDIAILKSQLIGLRSVDGQTNQVVNVNEELVTRVDTLFSFHLSRKVMITDIQKLEMILQQEFATNMNTSTKDLSVSILRQARYLTVKGETVWKVEYLLRHDNNVVDASITQQVDTSTMQSQINVVFGAETGYVISEFKRHQLIDYRHKVELYFSSPIANENLVKIEMALNETYSLPAETKVLFRSEELIDIYGMSVWQVSAFVYYGSNELVPYVPGWGFYGGLSTINITSLRAQVDSQNITGASGHVTVLEITGEGLRHRESSLSILLKNVIKNVDTENISLALQTHWEKSLSSSVNISVSVDIARQEELVDIHGNTLSRLVYFLSTEGTFLTSQDISPANATGLQEVLTSYLTTERKYEVVIETNIEIFQYESLFVFYMTSPILLYDIVEFQIRLETLWQQRFVTTNLTEVTTNILLQEEMVSSSTANKAWKISYSLHRESEMVDSRSIVSLELEEVRTILTNKFNKTSTDYSSSLLTSPVPFTHLLKDLFSIHLRHRVALVDYQQFEASLELFWAKTIMNVTAKILRQEEELEVSGESVWRLSYVITSDSETVSSTKIVQSNAETMNRAVNVTSPSGVTYAIVDVTESVRIEEMYSLHITRKLYRGDVSSLLQSVKTAVQTLIDGQFLNIVVEWKGQTEFRKKQKSDSASASIWRQLFVVKMSNKYITPLNYGSLNEEKITLNFTSVKGDNYETLNVGSLSALYSRADMQFMLTVNGRIKERDYTMFYKSLEQSWNETYESVIAINVQSNEEYIGDKGAIISRISLFALNGTDVIDPDTMRTPHVDTILANLKTNGLTYTAYTGRTAVRHRACFTLLLRGDANLSDISDIKDTIKRAWVNTTGEQEGTEVIFNKQEMFVGEFGVTLTNILYTVRINGRMSQTDDDIPPTVNEIEALKAVASSWRVYSKKAYYRLDDMFEVKVQISSEMTSEQVATIESGILNAWTLNAPGSCGTCEIHIVRGENLLTSNSTSMFQVTNLRYTLRTESNIVTPWTKDPPANDNLMSSINNQTVGVSLWTKGDNLYTVREMFLMGYTAKLDTGNVSKAIRMAWATKTGVQVTKVTGQVSHADLYSDTQWNKLTRVQFYVSVDSKDPKDSAGPSKEDVNAALESVGVGRNSCDCVGFKLRKVYVKGKSHIYSAIASAIRQTWMSTNNETDSLSTSLTVRVKQQNRGRRAVPSSELVDDNGDSVSRLDYTVTVEGQDPDPLFVQQPSQEDLDRSLKASGADNCNCNPGKVDHIKLKGDTKDEEKDDIAEAIKNAVAKSNPDMNPADISVKILDVANNEENGKPVSYVTYAVRRTDDDDIEALVAPSEAHLSKALEAAGKSLASREVVTKKPTTQEIDWVVPVAVVCGLAGFAVICIIGFYFIYVRRHRKNADLKRTQRNIENNLHDEEHFTNPVMFNNPMYGTPKSKHQSVLNDGL